MLKNKLSKLKNLAKKVKPNNRKVAMTLDPTAPSLLQTRRFFANNQESHEDSNGNQEEVAEKIVPVSQERDKVFTEKKMTVWDHIKVAAHHVKKGFVTVGHDTVYLASILKEK